MYPFLILSSLSIGFYLVVLVALHHDTRQHRQTVAGARSTSFQARTLDMLSSTIGLSSNRRNTNVSKVTLPTFFAPDPIASGSIRYPNQAGRPFYSAGLHQVRPSGDARPSRRESFHA